VIDVSYYSFFNLQAYFRKNLRITIRCLTFLLALFTVVFRTLKAACGIRKIWPFVYFLF